MVSEIKLTGKYKDNNGKEKDVEANKGVRVIWNASNINEENNSAYITGKVVTNKEVRIDENTTKKMVQVVVTSGIKNNVFPIKETNIEINVPKLNNDVLPETVKVITYDSLKWSHQEENGKVNIKIENIADSHNNVIWSAANKDEYIITYIYPEGTDTSSIKFELENEIKLYDEDKTVLNGSKKSNEANDGSLEVVGIDTYITNQIYKSNLKIGKNVAYTERWSIGISYSSVVENIFAQGVSNEFYKDGEITKKANVEYKSTYINKEEFLKLFGEEGTITIKCSDDKNIIIDSNFETDENGNFVVSYKEGISKLSIITSKPIADGKLNVVNNKVVVADGLTSKDISDMDSLKSKVKAYAKMSDDGNSDVVSGVKDMNILAPKTYSKLGMNKTTLSTANVNDISFTVTLKMDDVKYELYDNPVFEINIPKYAKVLNINDINILNKNGLSLKSSKVRENANGSKTIVVELKGAQKEYAKENTQIVIDAQIKAEQLMPTKVGQVELKTTNNKETTYIKENPINVTFESEQGIMIANSIINDAKEITAFKKDKTASLGMKEGAKEVTVTGTIINNTNNEQKDVKILGRIEAEGTNINAKLKSAVALLNKDGLGMDKTVYYSVKENATINLEESNNGWTKTPMADAKSYLVVIPVLNSKDTVCVKYKMEIPANLVQNKELITSYTVNIGENVIAAPKLTLETEKEVKLDLTVTSSVPAEGKVFEGQEVIYTIEVKNTGDVTANNIKISNPVPKGTTLSKANSSTSWIVDGLGAGESIQKKLIVTVDDIEKNNTITNKTAVSGEYLPNELISALSLEVEKSGLRVWVESRNINDAPDSEIEVREGSEIEYSVYIKNETSGDMHNIKIEDFIPEGSKYDKGNLYDYNVVDEYGKIYPIKAVEFDSTLNKGTCTIDTLAAGQELVMAIRVIIGEINSDTISNKVIVTCEEVLGSGEEIVIEKVDYAKEEYTLSANITSETAGQNIKPNDYVRYNIEIENTGVGTAVIDIEDNIPSGLEVMFFEYGIVDRRQYQVVSTMYNIHLVGIEIAKGEVFKLEIVAKVSENATPGVISNEARIIDGNNKTSIGTIEHTIINNKEDVVDPTDPTDPTKPTDPTNPADPTEDTGYKITGIAWLDKNKNGKRDEDEDLLQGVKVKIKENGQYLKDAEGKEKEVTTDENGKYEIANLEDGKSYILVFDFDKQKYKVTDSYKAAGVVETLNSDVKTVTEDGASISRTDNIAMNGKDVSNIDIGLVLNPVFDLRLDKYISKATVQNEDGKVIYEYNSETGKTAKIDVRAKYLNGTVVVLEYTIAVTNDGDISGYAKTIVDYMPKELVFKSELNSNWYQDEDNNLYCLELANDEIKPGETKSVKLKLTKTMTSDNTGLTSNSAEIFEAYNEYSVQDTNSTPGNKEINENDYSFAEIIMTIRTGGTVMYIGIVITCMAILGRRNIYY